MAIVSFAVLAAMVPAHRAYACGGFFCSTAPVVQAGEEIVYALEDDGSLTMSVRLAYQGSDPDFAWLLPLPAPPELSLGSDALFVQLRAATAPLFLTDVRTDGTCRPEPTCVTREGEVARAPVSFGCGSSSAPSTGWTGDYVDAGQRADTGRVSGWDAGGRSDGGVDVFSEGTVGPYDTVVLGAANAVEVLDWLTAHDYQVPGGSEDTLDAYAARGHVFIALRLSTSATTSQIAPIVMHLPVEAPCLPLRLTAISTVPDLPITAWFLGRARVVPTNYSVVPPQYLDPRFWTESGFYGSETTRRIDALGGQAFTTEYAGATPALPLEVESLSDLAGMPTPEIVAALTERGYVRDPAFARIAASYVTVPAGQTLFGYLNCVAVAVDDTDVAYCGETGSIDAGGLALALEREIAEPRRHAQSMIDAHPYVTRMFTTMSAAEMTLDPEFRADEALGDVAAVNRSTVITRCDSNHYLSEAPTSRQMGTREVQLSSGSIANDLVYCHSRGLVLPSEVTSPPPSTAPRSSGCHCATQHAPARRWWIVGALAWIGWARTWRRRATRASAESLSAVRAR
jgi:hypothetical protein